MSIKEITSQLGVSKSSVSIWVRDVPLTKEQLARLRSCAVSNGKLSRVRAIKKHLQYQEEGKAQAKLSDALLIAGCMLYWAEGSKTKHTVEFTNTDPDMIKFFVKFLRDCFNVSTEKITISVNCFTDNGLTSQEIHDFWLTYLALPSSSFRKGSVDKYSKSSNGFRKGSYLYGTCRLRVHDVKLLHRIYGAIQYYIGKDKFEWE